MDHLLLRTADDCDAAARAGIALEPATIALDLGLAVDEERRLERELMRLRNACGCRESAIALAIGLGVAVYLISAFDGAAASLAATLGWSAIGLFSVCLTAGSAKIAALWLHRRAYRCQLRALARQLRCAQG